MENTFVSIIAPTYRDWDRLALCIEALTKQTYPRDKFEFVIVNNDPNDPVPAGFNIPEGFILITEGKPGSYAARNAALAIVKGNIIGFTDSDCIPDPNWIKNAVDYFDANPTCNRIAGYVSVFSKTGKPTLAEKYDKIYAFRQKQYVAKYGTCVTANVFAYKYVFDAVGGFNDTKMSFGDFEWGSKANKAGFSIHYVENVMVKHPARELHELITKEKRLAGGREMSRFKKRSKAAVLINFLQDARPRLRGEMKFISSNASDMGTMDKLSILALRCRLIYVKAYESMLIRMGKTPNRV